jgi:hypothetical protein
MGGQSGGGYGSFVQGAAKIKQIETDRSEEGWERVTEMCNRSVCKGEGAAAAR